MESNKVWPGLRKGKNKQVKDEIDRLKQAEKKKRRLEKALATSAAIRSELEKKKEKRKEQQRLDEEGAAIAESVALHVLCEDSGDSSQIMLNKDDGLDSWDCASNIDLFMGGSGLVLPRPDLSKYLWEGLAWIPYAQGSGCNWNKWVNIDWSISPRPFGRDPCSPYFHKRRWETAEVASQAFASLQISEEPRLGPCVFNRMLPG
ncbi:hypothetical protein NMG60_11018085 [Bertholletia excelsa]